MKTKLFPLATLAAAFCAGCCGLKDEGADGSAPVASESAPVEPCETTLEEKSFYELPDYMVFNAASEELNMEDGVSGGLPIPGARVPARALRYDQESKSFRETPCREEIPVVASFMSSKSRVAITALSRFNPYCRKFDGKGEALPLDEKELEETAKTVEKAVLAKDPGLAFEVFILPRVEIDGKERPSPPPGLEAWDPARERAERRNARNQAFQKDMNSYREELALWNEWSNEEAAARAEKALREKLKAFAAKLKTEGRL